MDKLNSNHWLILIGILGVLATVYGWSEIHDFSASVDRMLVDIDQGSSTNINVNVDSGLLYREDIRLSAESVSSYIHVRFIPEVLKSGDKPISQVIISADKEAPLGEFEIPIMSTGADGKEHVCKFKLKVLSSSKLTPTQSELTSTPTPIEATTKTEIKITYPSNTSTVKQYERVIGTTENVPDGFYVWILGYSDNGDEPRYYPRSDSVNIPQNGEWSIPIQIGSDDESGASFDIIAVLANTQANERFQEYITNCERNDNWPGIEEIPEGATIYDKKTVTRE